MFDKILPQHPTIYKYDKMWIGVIAGLLVPTLGIVLVYLYSVYEHYSQGEEIISIITMIRNIHSVLMLTRFLSVGCILNLGVFFLFINRNYYNICRGIILATMLVSVPIMAVSVKSWFS